MTGGLDSVMERRGFSQPITCSLKIERNEMRRMRN